uniref:Uncharacterized protein n=1 Tax=Cyprinus carpio TaxID=7962 RepID=A0A8C1GTU7_CYPCA
MQVTDIGSREDGKIWHRISVSSKYGYIQLCISSVLATVIRASARQTKTVRFLQVAFDTTGESFLAGDHHHGNIYVFDISTNSWMRGHEGAISSLSVHSSHSYAISTSSDNAQLWNLYTFSEKEEA